MENNNDEFVEMMDMMVRMQLLKSIENSFRSITENIKDMESYGDIPLEKLHDLSNAFENLDKTIIDISKIMKEGDK